MGHLRTFAAVGLIAALTTSVSRADYFSTDTRLPSPTYHSTNPAPIIYNTPGGPIQIDSFFDVFVDLERVPLPAEGTPAEIHSFFDVFTELSIEPLGAPPQLRESPSLPKIQMLRLNGLPPGTPIVDLEMLQLDISGGNLPPGVMIRESPTLQSTGKTAIVDQGGGLFRINSFFDVFTELSVDGGASWAPGSAPLHLDGLPEPSTAAVLLVGASALTMRRRRRAPNAG